MKIFFDLDGTLIDIAPRHYRVYSECVELFGGKALQRDVYWGLKRSKVDWEILCKKSAVAVDNKDAFLAVFRSKIEEPSYLAGDKLFPGVEALLGNLTKKHECYLVSLRRKPHNLLDQIEALNIRTMFREVIYGHSENDGSDVKTECISTRLRAGDRALVCGDTEADIKAARQLQLLSVGVLSGIRDKVFLQKLQPNYLLPSATDIVMILELR